ncbi:hypothetical protein LWI28_028067 [Acer negundo]|uniref:Pentatricopeptide repeat-containing protein n=1 Tax=Acer negundo TaxID=4023 RepID=A0AAD5P4Z5_ACENE|nr:hypothetical protein LWI28_028067 [Acer negundo]KAK4857824.1 hypothetical protein QYF36_006839 [Acer negundo]
MTFGTLLAGFYKEEKYKDVGKVLKMMGKYRIKPGLNILNIRIQSLCGDYETALKVCNDSMEMGWVSNFSTMKLLVNGLAGVSKVKEAKELVGLMKAKFTKDVDILEEISNATMKLLVNGLAGISKVKEAKELVGLMKVKFTKDVDMWDEIEAGLP